MEDTYLEKILRDNPDLSEKLLKAIISADLEVPSDEFSTDL
jgi:uncharacterized protein YneF (UPF0154 family)